LLVASKRREATRISLVWVDRWNRRERRDSSSMPRNCCEFSDARQRLDIIEPPTHHNHTTNQTKPRKHLSLDMRPNLHNI